MKHRYKLTISYDGTEFGGWQIQPNAPSIQENIENALSKILNQPTRVFGAGRTDSGVHALGQIAHFDTEKKWDAPKLLHSLNCLLPKSIRVRELVPVPSTFHARFSPSRKTYTYHLHLGSHPSPFIHRTVYPVPYPLDLERLEQGLNHLVGTQDFTAFANEASQGAAINSPIKTIFSAKYLKTSDGLKLEFEGSGFLYKMVRNMVGTLLDVASCKIPSEKIPEILASKDRRCAGKAVPPHALFLTKIDYELQND